jgi:hypothetical protein
MLDPDKLNEQEDWGRARLQSCLKSLKQVRLQPLRFAVASRGRYFS